MNTENRLLDVGLNVILFLAITKDFDKLKDVDFLEKENEIMHYEGRGFFSALGIVNNIGILTTISPTLEEVNNVLKLSFPNTLIRSVEHKHNDCLYYTFNY